MDDFDRFMSHQRALRRARLKGGQVHDLWNFEKWGDGRTEEHHFGRVKFSKKEIITVPTAMHLELTRRGEEEHPLLGRDPDNPLERQSRLHFGLSDMHAALSDAHRFVAEAQHGAVKAGHSRTDAVDLPQGLLGWMARIAHDVARATKRTLKAPTRE